MLLSRNVLSGFSQMPGKRYVTGHPTQIIADPLLLR